VTALFPLVFDNPDDVRARLAALGLRLEVLDECIMDGRISRAGCTDNDPPSFPGTTMWAVITRSLRVRMASEGWEKSDEDNYSIVLNAPRTLAIAVATGDEATGRKNQEPHTKYPKGPATRAAVEANKLQLDLFTPAEPVPVIREAKEPLTWILLVRPVGSEAYAELSLPLIIGDGGRIEKWRERILLPLSRRGDDGSRIRRRPPEPGPDIEVAVTRRVS